MTNLARLIAASLVLSSAAFWGCAGTDNPVPGNSPPEASLGVDGANTVIVGTSVTLDASGTTDPDGDDIRIRWSVTTPEGSEVSMAGKVGETQIITPDVPGTYQVTITVSDELSEDVASTVVMATEPENRTPEADAGDSRNAERNTNVVLDGSNSTDPDGDELSFAWEFDSTPTTSSAQLLNAESATPSFTPDEDGTYVIVLTVTDPDGLTDTDTVSIAVGTDNAHPVADAGDNLRTEPDTTVTLTGTASEDPDGDGLTYSWTIDSTPDGSNASLTDATLERAELSVDLEGAYVVELEVTDTGGLSDADTVTVNVSTDNQPPVARFSVPGEVEVGESIAVDGRNSTDPDGDSLTHYWDVTEAPDTTNPSSDTGGIVEIDVFFEGSYTVELTVEDPGGLTNTTTRSFVGIPAVPGTQPTSAGDLVITEFLADPEVVGDNAGGEWFELYNPDGSETYQLKDCVLSDDDSDTHTIPDSVPIGPGEYVTLADGADPGFAPSYSYGPGFTIANSSDEIILTCGGTVIDRVNYDGGYVTKGASTQLDNNSLSHTANDTASNWCDSTESFNGDLGTPGAPNDPC